MIADDVTKLQLRAKEDRIWMSTAMWSTHAKANSKGSAAAGSGAMETAEARAAVARTVDAMATAAEALAAVG